MPVVKFAHWSGPFKVTADCKPSTKFQTFIVPELLRFITADDAAKTNPLAWLQYFKGDTNSDNMFNVAIRLINQLYLKKPSSRYFKKAPTVYDATRLLYPSDAVNHYNHVAAALAMLAKIGLVGYDQYYTLEATVDTCLGRDPLTPQQIVGLADAMAFVKAQFEADFQLGVSASNTSVNLGRHKEGDMPAWVSDMVPTSVINILGTAQRRVIEHATHYTADGSYNSLEHFNQLKRMFAAYLASKCSTATGDDEWGTRYSHLHISTDVLNITNFWGLFTKSEADSSGNEAHCLMSFEELQHEYQSIEFREGLLVEAVERVLVACKKGAIKCNTTDVINVIHGSEYYSRTCPFVTMIADGIRLPAFDAHTPTDSTHVALLDIDVSSGPYGHSFSVDNGITTTVSAFIHDAIDSLVGLYNAIKTRYAQQSPLAVASAYLDATTAAKVKSVPLTYLIDTVIEGDVTKLVASGSSLKISATYDIAVEASLQALGFTKVNDHFEYDSFEKALTAMTIAGGFAFIKDDAWYGIDLTDAKLREPVKQYQDSFRSYMNNQNFFVTINPHDKNTVVAVHIPGTKNTKPEPIWQFTGSIGLSREALVIREVHYKDLMEHFFEALKAICVPVTLQCELDISDILINFVTAFAKDCNAKYGARCKTLVAATLSNQSQTDSSLEDKLDRKRARTLTAINVYLALLKLVAPEVYNIMQWAYDTSATVAVANHTDYAVISA